VSEVKGVVHFSTSISQALQAIIGALGMAVEVGRGVRGVPASVIVRGWTWAHYEERPALGSQGSCVSISLRFV
jgi:hypothetical protein